MSKSLQLRRKLDSVLNKENKGAHNILSVPKINAMHNMSINTLNLSPSEAEVSDQESEL